MVLCEEAELDRVADGRDGRLRIVQERAVPTDWDRRVRSEKLKEEKQSSGLTIDDVMSGCSSRVRDLRDRVDLERSKVVEPRRSRVD